MNTRSYSKENSLCLALLVVLEGPQHLGYESGRFSNLPEVNFVWFGVHACNLDRTELLVEAGQDCRLALALGLS